MGCGSSVRPHASAAYAAPANSTAAPVSCPGVAGTRLQSGRKGSSAEHAARCAGVAGDSGRRIIVAPPAAASVPGFHAHSGGSSLVAACEEEKRRMFDAGEFEKVQLLDQTQLSTVHCLRHRRSGRLYAGKRSISRHANATVAFDNEVRMLRRLVRNTNVVDLHGIWDDGADSWMVLELCGGGRLEAWIGSFPATAVGVASQLLIAVEGLHAALVVHLDIKPDNVLLDDNGCVKLCDLATAQQLEGDTQLLSGNCGTDGFKAPEVSRGGRYSGIKADVFSTGKTLLFIARTVGSWSPRRRGLLAELTAELPERRPALAHVREQLQPSSTSGVVADVSGAARGAAGSDNADAAAGDPLAELMAREPLAQAQPHRSSGRGGARAPLPVNRALPPRSVAATGIFAPL
eukprot:TRINITY_DN6978_c0_g1_i2.p1 TRINITY_DN6978_c0_g1~~TRINITY_DN6978_c0_g1_i2.p1  ORF type:complete len:432 (-),score=76.52 TRINITY_DN6978_c0_g1_i2:8-1219(-)